MSVYSTVIFTSVYLLTFLLPSMANHVSPDTNDGNDTCAGWNKTTNNVYNGTAWTEVLDEEWKAATTFNFKLTNYAIAIAGVLLNLLTLITLLRRKGPLKLRLKLLSSLAVSDLLIALLSVFYYDICWAPFNCAIIYTSMTSNDSMFIVILKYVLNDIYSVAQYVGLSTMFAISIDLLYAVRKPFRYHQWSTGTCGYRVVVLLWLIPSVFQLVFSVITSYSKLGQDNDLQDSVLAYVVYWSYYISASLSLIVFIVIYCCIICILRRQLARAPTDHNRNIKKIVYTTVFIIGTYVLCMVPLVWLILLSHTLPFDSRSIFVSEHLVRLLYVGNTLCDPIIFSVRVPEIRNGIKSTLKLVLCFTCRIRTSQPSLSDVSTGHSAVTPSQ